MRVEIDFKGTMEENTISVLTLLIVIESVSCVPKGRNNWGLELHSYVWLISYKPLYIKK